MISFSQLSLLAVLLIILTLSTAPAFAVIEPVKGACGFPGAPNCVGGETVNNVINFLNPFIDAALLLIGTLAVIFLVYAGSKYISSRGDEEEAKRAKLQIAYAIIGIVVALGARTIKEALLKPTAKEKAEPIITLVTPFIDMALLLIGIAAVIFLIYAGYKYVMSRGEEEEAKQAKMQIAYAVIGVVVALSAYTIRNALINPVSNKILAGRPGAILIYSVVSPLIGLASSLIGIAAVIFLIYAGVKYISSTGDEEEANQAKRQIVYAIIGLSVAGLAQAIIIAVAGLPMFFIKPDLALLLFGIYAVVNRLLALVGIAAAIFLVYAGVKYIMSEGDEEETNQAKRQIIYAIIGLVVIGLSAVIVNIILGVL